MVNNPIGKSTNSTTSPRSRVVTNIWKTNCKVCGHAVGAFKGDKGYYIVGDSNKTAISRSFKSYQQIGEFIHPDRKEPSARGISVVRWQPWLGQ